MPTKQPQQIALATHCQQQYLTDGKNDATKGKEKPFQANIANIVAEHHQCHPAMALILPTKHKWDTMFQLKWMGCIRNALLAKAKPTLQRMPTWKLPTRAGIIF